MCQEESTRLQCYAGAERRSVVKKESSIPFGLVYPQSAINKRAFSIQLARKFGARGQKEHNSSLEPPTIVYYIYHVGPGSCSIASNAPHTLYASRHLLVCKDSRLSNSCYVMKLFLSRAKLFLLAGYDSSLVARHPHLVCLALPHFPTPHVRSPSPSDRPSMWHVNLYSVAQGRNILRVLPPSVPCLVFVIFSMLTFNPRLPLDSLYKWSLLNTRKLDGHVRFIESTEDLVYK